MNILVSNDDGIYSEGMRALARQLSKIAAVTIVAPDREQSAVGTAVNLRKQLRVQEISPPDPGIQAFAVEGTPSDSVIVGLAKIVQKKVDLVISGINQGSNLGEDVLISGTVGAALSAYLRGFPAMAVSCERTRWDDSYLREAGRFTAVLAKRVFMLGLPSHLFLNINLPDRDIADIRGVRLTRLAHKSHVNTVEEGHDGKKTYYTLVREAVNHQVDRRSDIMASIQGCISITPLTLFTEDRIPARRLEGLIDGLIEEYRGRGQA
ncbi:MAG: 5'/3'-nucleotidase SurE [Dehalococcoidales bacterium]|nr:5'/3'-nucleotidase SurE [Dehalococcoidales bacterium]